ncbi:hypothetical protein HUJ04_006725 [Dendroctonus ponderosae]|nr:hypothetical protein HUJ04_006725 [Dendroctonus ponderosae]
MINLYASNGNKLVEEMNNEIMPVATTKPARSNKNVILKMETMQGPLALLRKYTTERTRIKIITRNEKGVRGYCMAYLLAFDKHFNLVLDKVDEVWHRSIKVNKSPLLIDGEMVCLVIA